LYDITFIKKIKEISHGHMNDLNLLMKSIIFCDNAFYYSVTVPAVSNLWRTAYAGKVFHPGEGWRVHHSQSKLTGIYVDCYAA